MYKSFTKVFRVVAMGVAGSVFFIVPDVIAVDGVISTDILKEIAKSPDSMYGFLLGSLAGYVFSDRVIGGRLRVDIARLQDKIDENSHEQSKLIHTLLAEKSANSKRG